MYPCVSTAQSWTRYEEALEPFYDEFDDEFMTNRTKVKKLLSTADDLVEIIELVGRDALNECDKVSADVSSFPLPPPFDVSLHKLLLLATRRPISSNFLFYPHQVLHARY